MYEAPCKPKEADVRLFSDEEQETEEEQQLNVLLEVNNLRQSMDACMKKLVRHFLSAAAKELKKDEGAEEWGK